MKDPAGRNDRTLLESALLRDRWLIGASLAVAVALCWAWIVPMARDMYGPMDGLSAWMMDRRWDFTDLALLFAMWLVMMAGMMLPSAAPTLLLYAGVIRKSPERDQTRACVYAFAGGYLLVWTAFSLGATIIQCTLRGFMLLSSMMELRSPIIGGVLLILAGLYQWTPLKQACLESCRAPAAFIAQHWKRGIAGGFHLGLTHGLYCLGCCWVLMLLLFVGGVMNLAWIGILTFFVLLEKILPLGAQGGRLSGLLMIALGLWIVMSPHAVASP